MNHTVALVASLASLGITCAIYYCNILSSPRSWLRNDVIAMILLAMLTGAFPLAVAASLVGLWQVLTGGLSLVTVLSSGVDLASIGVILAVVYVFRALVDATYRNKDEPRIVTPLSAKPV